VGSGGVGSVLSSYDRAALGMVVEVKVAAAADAFAAPTWPRVFAAAVVWSSNDEESIDGRPGAPGSYSTFWVQHGG